MILFSPVFIIFGTVNFIVIEINSIYRLGHLDILQSLIENGADINACNVFRTSVLQWAIIRCSNNVKLIEVLLNKGADVNHRNLGEDTALLLAASKSKLLFCTIGVFIRSNSRHNFFFLIYNQNKSVFFCLKYKDFSVSVQCFQFWTEVKENANSWTTSIPIHFIIRFI